MTNTSTATKLQSLCSSAQWPQVRSVVTSENSQQILLFIQPDNHWLEGHFPQQALVAGVVQTHWAGNFAETLFDLQNFQQIDNLKFQEVMLPDQEVELCLEFNSANHSVKFRYQRPGQTDQVFSEGKIQFTKTHSGE